MSLGHSYFLARKIAKNKVFQQFSPRSGENFQHFFQQFLAKIIFLAIIFSIFRGEKVKKSFLAILVKFLFSIFFKQFSPQSTEHFKHFLAIFGAKRRKFANSLKTTGKFIKNTLFQQFYLAIFAAKRRFFLAFVFSNFGRVAANFFKAIVFQQFSPRSGEKKISIFFLQFFKKISFFSNFSKA